MQQKPSDIERNKKTKAEIAALCNSIGNSLTCGCTLPIIAIGICLFVIFLCAMS